jgi:transcriptional regulator with XRE-family HTH domain
MSDLYLILRRRLEDVTDWVELGTATLLNARKALGLSYEAMGRKLSVASKTYERYEKKGRVPRHLLPRVAEVLNLEIDWPKPTHLSVTAAGEDRLETLEQRLAEVLALVQQLRAEMLEQRQVPAAGRVQGDRAT